MKCIIVDDEPLALMQMCKYIERTPDIELVASCYDAAEALDALKGNSDVDVIFLDINMPDMSGIELARSLTPMQPMIVFTTAYSEYALEGFKVEAVDYLTKPIAYEEFLKSLERVRRRLQSAGNADDAIYVKDSGSTRRILLNDITMIKSLAEYVQIYTAVTSRPVITLMSMRSLEEKLPADRFMRIHRSYIINLSAIEKYEHNKVKIANEELPVSDSYRNKLKDYINSKLNK